MKSFSTLITWASMALAFGAIAAPGLAALPEASTLHVTTTLDVGGTILEAGDYLIRLDPSDQNRNLLQVTSPDGTEIFTTVLSVPHALGSGLDEGGASFVYYPTADGAPQVLRTWFAPDSTSGGGHDIVYPRARAIELAAEAGEPVHAYTEPATTDELASAEVVVVTPEEKIVPDTSNPSVITPEEEPVRLASATMPETAGALPLFGMLGLLLLGAAIGVHVYRVS